jgi:hypothetical protein
LTVVAHIVAENLDMGSRLAYAAIDASAAISRRLSSLNTVVLRC